MKVINRSGPSCVLSRRQSQPTWDGASSELPSSPAQRRGPWYPLWYLRHQSPRSAPSERQRLRLLRFCFRHAH
ncbi:hypothetical protein B566_EDAN017326, partial [Ephemera danica]